MRAIVLAMLLVAPGCPGDDDDTTPTPGDCTEGDLYEAEACAEFYCGAATVEVGTGSQGFEPITDGMEVPVWYGSQGGYHIDITTRMQNLCPIVFLVPTMFVVPDGGDPIEIFTQNRHVQAVRTEPDVSPEQDFWGIRGFVSCEYWPNDPENPDVECGDGEQGSAGRIDELEVILRMEAWDHNVDAEGEAQARYDVSEHRVQPTCCNY